MLKCCDMEIVERGAWSVEFVGWKKADEVKIVVKKVERWGG